MVSPDSNPDAGADRSDDPLERLERNERQSSQAIRYVLLSAVAVVVLALVLLVVGGGTSAECPDTDGLCLTTGRVEVVVLPTLLSLILSVLSAVLTYRRWKNHVRWRPWLFATYAMWMITTAYLLGSSSAVFMEVG